MKTITILWLDDLRNPSKYFDKRSNSDTFKHNSEHYSSIFSKYDVNFVWVKNYHEFVNYLEHNDLPDIVSFDYDLGLGLKKGAECAKWLVQYCKVTNQPLPKYYPHSANRRGREEINNVFQNNTNTIRITESKLRSIISEEIKKILLEI